MLLYKVILYDRKVYILLITIYSMTKQSNTKINCPNCNAENIKKDGLRITENRGKIQRFKCRECSKRFVLDFISWAIFRNYEYKDPSFIEIINDKIVIRKEIFQKKYLDPRD